MSHWSKGPNAESIKAKLRRKRSPETIARIKASRHFGPEWRAKISAAARKRRHSEQWKRANAERMKGNTHRRGKASSEATRSAQSARMKGRIFSKSHRLALSKAGLGHPPRGVHWRGRHVLYKKDGRTIALASSYELQVAVYLDSIGESWIYVSKSKFDSFPLGGGRRYYPDFLLPNQNVYIDPKGWDRDPEKRILIQSLYPGRVIFLIGKTYLTQLKLLLCRN
jgi:hypothetical protein